MKAGKMNLEKPLKKKEKRDKSPKNVAKGHKFVQRSAKKEMVNETLPGK